MIPISFAKIGEDCVIRKIGGSPEVKKHLENLGFSVGGNAMVISTLGGNVIVKINIVFALSVQSPEAFNYHRLVLFVSYAEPLVVRGQHVHLFAPLDKPVNYRGQQVFIFERIAHIFQEYREPFFKLVDK